MTGFCSCPVQHQPPGVLFPEETMENSTHEVIVLSGTIDVSWRAHQHIFYSAAETLAGTIILTPRAGIPARRQQSSPLREEPVSELEDEWFPW